MTEENFKVGDLVMLNEKGKSIFDELSDSYMPMRIDAIEDNVYKCLLKNEENGKEDRRKSKYNFSLSKG